MEKRVLLIAAGGTISSDADADKGVTVSTDKGTEALNDALRECLNYIKSHSGINVDLHAEQIAFYDDSSNIDSKAWIMLCDKIYENYDDFDSFIITHGTNTMGYTAAALSYALTNIGKPVIITGAQIGIRIPGSDSIMNLENTLRVAVDEGVPVGVSVCFGSFVIRGPKAKKKNSFDYDAFKSFSSSKLLGRVARVIDWSTNDAKAYSKFYEPFAERQEDLFIESDFDTNIASFTESPGIPLKVYTSAIEDAGVKGIILRAYGNGDPSVALHPFFELAREREVPIVITTQAPEGNARGDINEPGILSRKFGVIHIYDMSMEAMFTKMAWLLGKQTDYRKFKVFMQRPIKGDITIKKDPKLKV